PFHHIVIEVFIRQRFGRDVNGHGVEFGQPVWVLSEIIERVSNHPTVDGWHDPETLGGGQECTWTDQFPLLALQTQQNFPVPIIERGNDRADGLVTEQEVSL